MVEPAYTRKETYVLRLHELLWRFVEQHDSNCDRTGDVVACAEQVLALFEVMDEIALDLTAEAHRRLRNG